jgi:hypothetical protein
MLWVDGALGPVERACIRSVLAQGHRLVLWHYGPLKGVPEGVELADGDEVVPRERLFRHVPSASWALFSNLFRYCMLQQARGLWLDSDMYLLRPIPWDGSPLFGLGESGLAATSLIGLPADNPVLAELIAYFDAHAIPPWLPLRWRLRFAFQRAIAGSYRLETVPWGTLGPHGFTALLKRHGLLNQARPMQVFVPWSWREANWIFSPDEPLESRITPDTLAAHLFNEVIRPRKNLPPPPGSFIERLHREGA